MSDEEEQERRPFEYVGDDPAYEDDDDSVLDDSDDSAYDDDDDGWPLSPEHDPG